MAPALIKTVRRLEKSAAIIAAFFERHPVLMSLSECSVSVMQPNGYLTLTLQEELHKDFPNFFGQPFGYDVTQNDGNTYKLKDAVHKVTHTFLFPD